MSGKKNLGDGDFSDSNNFGTLDVLIKRPRDFNGLNNPFCLSSNKMVEHSISSSSETKTTITNQDCPVTSVTNNPRQKIFEGNVF